jgi:hypothetical protein
MDSEKGYLDREELYRQELKREMKAYAIRKSTDKIETLNIENKTEVKENKVIPNTGFRINNLLTNNIITNNLGVLTDNIITNNIITKNFIPNIISKKKIFSWIGLPNNFDEISKHGKWWRFYDSGIVICNILVFLIAIYDYELNFTYPRKVISEYNNARILMVIISLIAVFFVIKRHQNKQKWKNDNSMPEQFEIDDLLFGETSLFFNKKPKFLRFGLMLDIVINLILPYPYLDFKREVQEIDRETNDYVIIEYLFSDIIYIMIILRTIYIIRATINYSIFMDEFACTICKEHSVKCNIRFALRCLIKTEHFKIVLMFLVSSILLLGFSLRVFERPFWAYKGKQEFEYLINSFWLVFITMMTIGYGDLSPLTAAGKAVCTIAGLWGTFITSLLVVCLYGLLDLSNDQFIVFTQIVKSREAVKFIEDAFMFRKIRNGRKSTPEMIKNSYNELNSSFSTFQNMRNESKSIYRSNGLLHYNLKLLNQMKRLHSKFDKIELDIESLCK